MFAQIFIKGLIFSTLKKLAFMGYIRVNPHLNYSESGYEQRVRRVFLNLGRENINNKQLLP